LDYLDPVLAELDAAERLKYILLLTDERQEAPPDSPYGSKDHSVTHPYLTYVNRRDFGTFRAITVGVGLDDRVSSTAESLASFLRNPPERSDNPLPGAPEGESSGTSEGGAAPGGSAGGSSSFAPETGASPSPLPREPRFSRPR
jgi:hypothetical protein